MDSRLFINKVRKSIKKLRLLRAREQEGEAYVWLADNHYLLESEGKGFLKISGRLKKLPQGGKRVIFLSEEYTKSVKGEVSEKSLDAFLSKSEGSALLTGEEFEALSLVISGHLLILACIGAETNDASLLSSTVNSIRQSDSIDMQEILSRHFFVARELNKEDFYKNADDDSKWELRQRVRINAKKEGLDEKEYLKRIQKSGDVLKCLAPETKKRAAALRLVFLVFFSCLPSILTVLLTNRLWQGLLLLPVFYSLFLPLIDTITLKRVRPVRLLRLKGEKGIGKGGETAVVISCLLTSPKETRELYNKLKGFFYSNPDKKLIFGLLADLTDSSSPSLPSDKSVINAAINGYLELTKEFPDRFFLFLRRRVYSETQQGYSGRERKRGAILDLMDFMREGDIPGLIFKGKRDKLKGCNFIFTLDADTDLSVGNVSELVCVALHEENFPVIENGRIVKGHGILAPRISTSLFSFNKTRFSKYMSGEGGTSPYTGNVGDIYQDLYLSGLFSGKGLIHVDSAREILKDSLPKEKILSHDIPEGCLLHAAYVSDVELTDGCPASLKGFQKRLHRWTRGDIQNLCLFSSPKLDALSKFKLFDNIRRAVTTVLGTLCLFLVPFLPLKSAILFLVAGLLSLAPGEYLTATMRFFHRVLFKGPYYGVSPAFLSLRRAFVLTLTAIETFFTLSDGIIRGLYRLFISKRSLMEWSTAAQGDKSGNVSKRTFFTALFLFLSMLFIKGTNFLLMPLVVLWLLSPLLFYCLDKRTPDARYRLNENEKETLRGHAAAMWRFFEENVSEKTSMLPPDNIQLQPVYDIAMRTSPTNIGLMLLSCLASRDLELISTREMTDILSSCVESCERLKKHKGNLYNWYDLNDLSLLSPPYLSSVDSGNFLCCLICLRQGILSYRGEDMRLFSLYERISRLIDETDLSVFADIKRNRLVTGLDSDRKMSSSAYDLLMSEALLTLYCGVARGQIPKKVFNKLNRICGSENGVTGALSWTGTMFEYFMPTLLLPVFNGSLIESSLKFSLAVQKDRVKKLKLPWGISESGYYGFDSSLHYQYRAHGVQKAALCRGQNRDLVVSPYSSFLALPFFKDEAMKNLDLLNNMGMMGEYGFYEALDVTPSRCGGKEKKVTSFMAHHIGMSMVAVANTLLDGIFIKRFMSDPVMASAEELLKERLPSASPIYRGFDEKRDEKPHRYLLPEREYDSISPLSPKTSVRNGGELTLILTDSGCGTLRSGDIDVTCHSGDLINDPRGLFCFITINNKTYSLTPAPDYSSPPDEHSKQVKFSLGETVYYAHFNGLDASLSFTLSGDDSLGAVKLTLKNLTGKRKSLSSLLYFEPMLSFNRDCVAHPAFQRLFVSVRKIKNGVVFSRRQGRGKSKISLAVLRDFEISGAEFDRSRLLSHPDGLASLLSDPELNSSLKENEKAHYGEVCGASKIKLTLPPYSQKSLTYYFGADKSEDGAVKKASLAFKQGYRSISASCSREALKDAALSDMDELCATVENLLLPSLLYPSLPSSEKKEAQKKLSIKGDGGLWGLGISGDLPIVLVEVGAENDSQRVRTFMKIHRHLSLIKIKSDLVFLCRDKQEYMRPVTGAVKREADALSLSSQINSKGGIFIIDVTNREDIENMLKARAAYIAPKNMMRLLPPSVPFVIKPVSPVSPIKTCSGVYSLSPDEVSKSRPWCHILANEIFGTLLSNTSIGHSYAFSSTGNRLSHWSNDPSVGLNGESLYLDVGENRYSLTRGALFTPQKNKAVYEGETEGLKSRVTVSLCGRLPLKKIEAALSSLDGREIFLTYALLPPLNSKGSLFKHFVKDNVLFWENMTDGLFEGFAFMFTDSEGENLEFLSDRAALLSGEDISSPYNGFALRVKTKSPNKITFFLGFASSLEGAERVIKSYRENRFLSVKETDSILISSEDQSTDLLTNIFLPQQISLCRIRARTAFYQSSGARGFRDQLQDACAEVIYDPGSARQQILRAACRQFKEGDVLHWWTDRGEKPPQGSRTLCSDDLLWLPYAVARYVSVTEDESLLNVMTPYIEGEELKGENEKFITANISRKKDSVYHHCLAAIRHGLKRGEHGLILMGTCDWNDGLSKTGAEGKGETVWGTMFFCLVCRDFKEICKRKNDEKSYNELSLYEKELTNAYMKQFDNDRFIRAYDDNGEPLGVRENPRMKIDILPQSFSCLLHPEDGKSILAAETVMKTLVDKENMLIRLFSPPFDSDIKDASGVSDGDKIGYIAAYPPGVRENGGQYTHGAIWFLYALLNLHRIEDAYNLALMISPMYQNEKRGEKYGGEPYFMAADVGANKNAMGKAGWTMYTGAAGWYYRLFIEEFYGLKRRGDRLYVSPKLPSSHRGFCARLCFKTPTGNCEIDLTVKRGSKESLSAEGKEVPFIPLKGGHFTAVKEII